MSFLKRSKTRTAPSAAARVVAAAMAGFPAIVISTVRWGNGIDVGRYQEPHPALAGILADPGNTVLLTDEQHLDEEASTARRGGPGIVLIIQGEDPEKVAMRMAVDARFAGVRVFAQTGNGATAQLYQPREEN